MSGRFIGPCADGCVMSEFLVRIPVPVCGVALGVMGLANICRVWSQQAAWLFCAASILLLCLYVARCIVVKGSFIRDMRSPVPACVFGTFPMTLLFLAQHIPHLGFVADVVYILGAAIQLVLIVYIAVAILPRMDLGSVHACMFVPFVGIAAMGASGAAVGMQPAGAFGAILGLALAFPVLIAVSYRYVRMPRLTDAEAPMFCIMAAPFALCTVAISGSIPEAPGLFRMIVYALALALYIVVLTRLPSLLRMGFVPSKASMGFPMTVSAVATYSVSGIFDGIAGDMLTALFLIQTVIAVVVMAHILIGYAGFLRPSGAEK